MPYKKLSLCYLGDVNKDGHKDGRVNSDGAIDDIDDDLRGKMPTEAQLRTLVTKYTKEAMESLAEDPGAAGFDEVEGLSPTDRTKVFHAWGQGYANGLWERAASRFLKRS